MYKVNLLPSRFLPEDRLQKRRVFFCLLLYFFSLIVICLFLTYRCYFLQQQVEGAAQELVSLQPVLTRFHEVQIQQRRVESITAFYSALQSEDSPWQETLTNIFSCLPLDIKITELEITSNTTEKSEYTCLPEKLILRGYTPSLQECGLFLSELKTLEGCRRTDVKEIVRVAEGLAFTVFIELSKDR